VFCYKTANDDSVKPTVDKCLKAKHDKWFWKYKTQNNVSWIVSETAEAFW